MHHVWVIDDDRSIRWVLEKALQQAGMSVTSFASGADVLLRLEEGLPDAVVTDIRMPNINGLELQRQISQRYPGLPVIIMTAFSDLDSTVAAFKDGAFEFLAKPFDVDDAVELVRRAVDSNPSAMADQSVDVKPKEQDILGATPAMQEVFRAIGRLSRSSITVLITGESGTGKELVAQALHRHSERAGNPFIAINTAAIPRDLLESDLFGHERGAFTGAQAMHKGRFEQAHGGTLFLDEIGDMPAELQTRLLRVLADGEFYRVGGHLPIKTDVRIIAATHQNLEARVNDGGFREDLYHRLNVIRIHSPALRERVEDIPILLEHYLTRAANELDTEVKRLRPEVIQHLQQLPWPGNVRQLENACRWLTVMASGAEIQMRDLPPELQAGNENSGSENDDWAVILKHWAEHQLRQGHDGILQDALLRFEQVLMEAALQSTQGRRQDAAKRLGWGRNTLTRKIKEHGM
jgi:two-component system nitrogen regulation response regulator GlnG